MNKENLYELLDIDCPSDFEYFENFSAYIESDEDFNIEDLTEIFSEVDKNILSDIISNYFDEIMDSLPNDAFDLTTIFENERKALMGLLVQANDTEEDINLFINEVERFREYYSINVNVNVLDSFDRERYNTSICDALFISRQEKFDGSKHDFDFSNVLNYEIDEYIMSFSDLISLDNEGDIYEN